VWLLKVLFVFVDKIVLLSSKLYRLPKMFNYIQSWNCRGVGVGGLNPRFMSTDAHF